MTGVTVREKDGAWWVFINHQSKRKAKRVGHKKAALAVAQTIQAKLTLGDLKCFESETPVPTVKAVAEQWLRANAPTWKAGTVRNYEGIVRSKILPAFGELHHGPDGGPNRRLVGAATRERA
ncbi:MAG: hypothetical protein HY712_04165 [candidate division NC10 bacterium]|nr:hypothetical protein [candidate division NC10 bacterium]